MARAPYAFVIALFVVLVVLTAFLSTVETASQIFVGGLVLLAVLRLGLPNGVVPSIRGRVVDCLTLFLFAGIIFVLAPWGVMPLLAQ